MTRLADLDDMVLRAINGLVGRSAAVDTLVGDFTDWNFFRCAWIVCILWWAWFKFQDSDSRLAIVSGILGLICATVLSKTIQLVVFVHERPFITAAKAGLTVPASVVRDWDWGHGSSFPSDTATLHLALATIVWSMSRRLGLAVFVWVALVVALPRLYMTYHYPSDLIGGAVLGMSCVLVAQRYRAHLKNGLLFRFEKTRPQLFYPILFLCTYQIVDAFSAAETGLRQAARLARATLGQ